MSLTIVNAPRPLEGTAEAALRETVASLEAQLASLYEEKAQGAAAGFGGASAGAVDAGAEVLALYEEKLRAGARANAELRQTVESFQAQLDSLYADREQDVARAAADAEASASLAEQLREFYALQEQAGGRPLADVVAMAASFAQQLDALYAEQQERGAVEALGGDQRALAQALASCEEQLVALYDEKTRPSPEALMVESLEAQVRALLDEKQDLETALTASRLAFTRAQERARELVGTLVEKSLALV